MVFPRGSSLCNADISTCPDKPCRSRGTAQHHRSRWTRPSCGRRDGRGSTGQARAALAPCSVRSTRPHPMQQRLMEPPPAYVGSCAQSSTFAASPKSKITHHSSANSWPANQVTEQAPQFLHCPCLSRGRLGTAVSKVRELSHPSFPVKD